MKYDDSEFYFLNFEDDSLDNDAAATHIGMYMAWIVLHEMAAQWHLNEDAEALRELKARAMTPGAFALDVIDGQMHDGDLSPFGNRFSQWYFQDHYYTDYADLFDVSLEVNVEFCSVPDTWENFDRLALLLDDRLEEWKAEHDVD
jgi:hypothetical protein